MACTACLCGQGGMSNTGVDCYPIFKVPKMAFLVPLYDNDGNRNGIALSDAEDPDWGETYWQNKINEADESKRFYPLPLFKNVDSVRADNIVETYNDSSTSFVQYGVKPFLGWFTPEKPGYISPSIIAAVNSARCGNFGVLMVDIDGNLRGTLSADGLNIYPTAIDSGSIVAKYVEATDTTNPHIEVSWNYSQQEKDQNLAMIACSELGDVDLLTLRGLLDVTSVLTNITDTTVTITLITNAGTPLSPVKAKGLVITDFVSSDSGATSKIYNSTTDADITITSVTESPAGSYNITVASAQSEGDELIPMASKDGYDFSALADNPWEIPQT